MKGPVEEEVYLFLSGAMQVSDSSKRMRVAEEPTQVSQLWVAAKPRKHQLIPTLVPTEKFPVSLIPALAFVADADDKQ